MYECALDIAPPVLSSNVLGTFIILCSIASQMRLINLREACSDTIETLHQLTPSDIF